MSNEPRETARFFTRSRRIPLVVGKLPDGSSIPFGPFKIAQAIGAAVAAFVLTRTTAIWANFGIFNLVVAAAIVIGVVVLIGKLPSTGRNPLSYGSDIVTLVNGPKVGKLNGRPLAVGRPHRVTHRVVAQIVTDPTVPVAAPDAAPEPVAATPTPTPAPRRAAPVPTPRPTGELTGVARLLSQSIARSGEETPDA